jgi:hypothetical protein
MMNWKGCGRSSRGLISRHYPGIFLKGLRNITKSLIQDSWSPGRDLNPGPLEYETGVLTTQPRRSVTLSKGRKVEFFEISGFHGENMKFIALMKEAISTSETSFISTRIHGATFQKMFISKVKF